jgi:hypothetical protein
MASRFTFPARSHCAARQRRSVRPSVERLESRLALSAATTTPAGLTIGQSLAAVISNAALDGIQVRSVSSFAPGPAAHYLLLQQPSAPAPFALVSYADTTNTATTQAFTTLAQMAGDGNQKFLEGTVVTQAAGSTSANTSPLTFGSLSNPKTNSLTITSGAGFTGTGFIYVIGASSVGPNGGGQAIFSYDKAASSLAQGSSTFRGLKPVGSVGLNEAITATVAGAFATRGSTATVTAASANGTTVTYTATNSFVPGQVVSITGLSTAAFNLQNVTIASASGTQFTVTNPATGPAVTNSDPPGVATADAYVTYTYTATNSLLPGQIVSIAGLSTQAFNLRNAMITWATPTQFIVSNPASGPAVTGASGTATFVQGFDDIQVPPGSVVIEACAPTPSQTIVRLPTTVPAKATTKFSLPVLNGLATNGFSNPSPQNPGSVIVALADGTTAIVTYTGVTNNGRTLTGCTVKLQAGQSRQVLRNAPVSATANAPVTFTFTNNSFPKTTPGLAVHVAIAGQQSDAAGNLTFGYLVPQQTANKNDFTKPLQFVSMASGSPPVNVPTFELFAAAAKPRATTSFKINNKPDNRMVATRIVFGMGLPPVVPINGNAPAFPAMSNPTDPNNRINFDFLEFTMRYAGPNDGTLFVNTTQVDQVGLPFTMNVSPADSSGASKGVGVRVGRAGLADAYANFVTTRFTGTGTGDQSISPAAEAAFKGLLTPYRLLNPSDAFTNPPASYTPASVPTLDGYFDAALATFFSNYTSGGFRLQRDGYNFVGTTQAGYQPAAYSYSGVTLGGVSGTTGTLTFPAVAVPGGTKPASISLAAGVLVTGTGITGTAVVTGQPAVDGNNVTTVTIAGQVAANSGTYTFTAPGEFTVLQLHQADATTWVPVSGGQQYQLYAPYFAGGAAAFPTGLPVGTGLGSLSLTRGGAGYTPNTVGQLTFTGGGGSSAAGFFVTDNTGLIIAIGLTNPGSGYTSIPTIGFTGAGTPTTAAVVTASALPAAPPWVAPGGPATVQSPGLMTFGCLGVFTDGGQQAKAGQVSGTNASGQTLLDIQNTIVSAFNRGVANAVAAGTDVTTFWNTAANFYPKLVTPTVPNTTGANWSNLYAAFLHQPNISIARPSDPTIGLAYGFAYDDQGGNSTTLTSSFPQTVSVTFKPWPNPRFAPNPLAFGATGLPQVKQGALSASLQGLAGKQYRWQLFQVPSPSSGSWTAVGTATTVTAGNGGIVSISATAPTAGRYALVVWAADVIANASPSMTAAAMQFGGQYAVSPRFTVPASQLRVATPRLRVAGMPAVRQPLRVTAGVR